MIMIMINCNEYINSHFLFYSTVMMTLELDAIGHESVSVQTVHILLLAQPMVLSSYGILVVNWKQHLRISTR